MFQYTSLKPASTVEPADDDAVDSMTDKLYGIFGPAEEGADHPVAELPRKAGIFMKKPSSLDLFRLVSILQS